MTHHHALRSTAAARRGFTLLELLVATTLTLILTALVVQVFAFVSDGVFNSRANMDLSDQLRNAKHRLIQDLRGTTAPTIPPLDPSAELGYFEYVEGGNVANTDGGDSGGAVTLTGAVNAKNTVTGDLDDILMFTTCSFDEEFVGKAGGNAAKSRYAEVVWFLRQAQTTNQTLTSSNSGYNVGLGYYNLHRRIWLINPNANWGGSYATADQSMRQELGMYESTAPTFSLAGGRTLNPQITRNSLGDLTMRERRSIHQPAVWPYELFYTVGSPSAGYDVVGINYDWPSKTTPLLTLPTLANQSHSAFPNPISEDASKRYPPLNQKWKTTATTATQNEPAPHPFLQPGLSTGGREPDDIILTNVISFDVKAWDPGAPVFRAKPTTAAGVDPNPDVVGVIVPGDAGYNGDGKSGRPRGALQRFIEDPAGNMPVSFGAYADLNYMWLNQQGGTVNQARRSAYEAALRSVEGAGSLKPKLPRPAFGFGDPKNPLSGYTKSANYQYPAVYDTWSRHYEYDGVDNDGDGLVDEGTNGLDDNGNGYIDEENVDIDMNGAPGIDINGDGIDDDIGERDAPPPYDAPLRGIKITIRVMEQDSRQVREVTIVHEFLPL